MFHAYTNGLGLYALVAKDSGHDFIRETCPGTDDGRLCLKF